jgi:hypothetical protein
MQYVNNLSMVKEQVSEAISCSRFSFINKKSFSTINSRLNFNYFLTTSGDTQTKLIFAHHVSSMQ